MGHICLFSQVRPVSINTYAATPPVIIILVSAQSQMFIALHEYEVRQHLVPHSSSVWSHEETTLTEHTFHWCWHSRCAEDPLEETMQDGELRLILHSFPWVSVMTKSQGYLRFWVRSPKQGLETFFQRPKPGRGLGIRDQGQGQGFNSRPRPRTLLAGLEAPRGQGHVLENSNFVKMHRQLR